jgi:hypothetical protein
MAARFQHLSRQQGRQHVPGAAGSDAHEVHDQRAAVMKFLRGRPPGRKRA